jgi:hypothetical protein
VVFPTVVVEGIGATEEAVPPVALVPYQFKVAPDKGVAVKATAELLDNTLRVLLLAMAHSIQLKPQLRFVSKIYKNHQLLLPNR